MLLAVPLQYKNSKKMKPATLLLMAMPQSMQRMLPRQRFLFWFVIQFQTGLKRSKSKGISPGNGFFRCHLECACICVDEFFVLLLLLHTVGTYIIWIEMNIDQISKESWSIADFIDMMILTRVFALSILNIMKITWCFYRHLNIMSLSYFFLFCLILTIQSEKNS